MNSTIEISLYPLSEKYENIVLDFLNDLNTYKEMKVETNGMSTQCFGDLNYMFDALRVLTGRYLENHQAILVMKVGKGYLRYQQTV